MLKVFAATMSSFGLIKHFKPKAILIDLSGTIHIDNDVIPGSIEALNRLRESNIKIKFVTNTTKESKNTLFNRLKNIGFNLQKDEIFTSLTAARNLIIKEKFEPMYLLSSDALEDFEGIKINKPNSVVVGLAPEKFNYENMTNAFRLLLDGASLIAIHKARYYKRKDGLALGPGAFVTGLEYSTGVKAKVVGKPEESFFMSAIEEFDCEKEDCVMIGDDARDDIEGALKAGLKGILVKTGKYRPNDETTIELPPTYVVENFADAVDKILQWLSPCN